MIHGSQNVYAIIFNLVRFWKYYYSGMFFKTIEIGNDNQKICWINRSFPLELNNY